MHIRRLLVTLVIVAGCAVPSMRRSTSERVALPTARELEADLERVQRLSRVSGESSDHITPAMSFVSARLAALGIAPAGDSGYLQRVPMVERSVAPATVLEVVTPTASRRLRTGDELAPLISLGAGMPAPRLTATGPVVFAGYASGSATGEAPTGADVAAGVEEARDALDTLPLAGAVVVAVMGAPPSASASMRAALDAPEQVAVRLQRLLAARPAAVILLFPPHLEGTYRALLEAGERANSLDAGDRTPPGQRVLPPVFVGPAQAGSPLLPSGWPLNDEPAVLEGHRFRADVVEAVTVRPTYNVVGILRGRDPGLAGRIVALGAEGPWAADSAGRAHAERREQAPGEDDGSGLVTLLAAARVLAGEPRPARSILFVIHPEGAAAAAGVEWFIRDSLVQADSIDLLLAPAHLARGSGDSVVVALIDGVSGGVAGAGRMTRQRLAVDDPLGVIDSVNAALVPPLVLVPWQSAQTPRTSTTRGLWPWVRAGVPVLRLSAPSGVDWLRDGTPSAPAMTRPGILLARLVRALASRDGGSIEARAQRFRESR
ncbi:MAG TPA: hypothetical protein VFG84_10400 [Gemmatimonadaceae bacterium]|nr:hypothetical protein [Gemmatimonadaceae bacterium]